MKNFNKCLKCGANTHNPKFCNRSCASSFNNTANPKRKPENSCASCGSPIISSWIYCRSCSPKKRRNWSLTTITDIQKEAKYQVSAVIRLVARRIYRKSKKPKSCCICGYNKHYEVCHIKSIDSFDPKTAIATVNNLGNLIGLCPNCHWELDHGFLTVNYPHLESNQEPSV